VAALGWLDDDDAIGALSGRGLDHAHQRIAQAIDLPAPPPWTPAEAVS